MQNKIEHLRNHLFATLEDLRDDDKPMDLDRAKVIAEVGQTIINSAKAENDYLKITGQERGSGFIPDDKAVDGPDMAALENTGQSRLALVRN